MWIQVFKSGEHTDSSGNTSLFSNEKLDEITSRYNLKVQESSSNEVPLVKGHPKSDAPAYGWIERLKRRGDYLLAKLKELSPEIVNEVKRGLFKKVSIALYPDLMLRHVGLLGAATPAVKGLQNVTFSNSENFLVYEDKYNNNLIGCESVIIGNLRKENDELKKKLDDLRKEIRQNEFSEFVNSLMDTEKGAIITPNQAEILNEILEQSLITSASENEFEENNSLFDKIKLLFSDMKPAFNFRKEFNFTSKTLQKDEFESNMNIDPARLDTHKRARQMQNEFPELSYEDALLKLQ